MEDVRLEKVSSPPPALDPRFIAIPDAPSPEACASYATALVERVRAILRFRLAERSSGEIDPTVAYEAVTAADQRVGELRNAHRFPFDKLCDDLGFDGFDRHTLAFAAAPHIDDTLRDDLRRYRQNPGRAHVDPALVLEVMCPLRHEAIRESRRFEVDWGIARAGLVEYLPIALGRRSATLECELVPTHHLLGLLRGQLGMHAGSLEHAELVRADPHALVGELSPERWAPHAAQLAMVRPTSSRPDPLVVLVGDNALGDALAHGTAMQWARNSLVLFDPPRHLAPEAQIAYARLVAIDAAFLGAVLVVRDRGADAADPRGASLLRHILRLQEIPRILVTPRRPDRAIEELATLTVETPAPDGTAVYRWVAELADASLGAPPELVEALAARAPWSRPRISIAIHAAFTSTSDGNVTGGHLFHAIETLRDASERSS